MVPLVGPVVLPGDLKDIAGLRCVAVGFGGVGIGLGGVGAGVVRRGGFVFAAAGEEGQKQQRGKDQG